MTLDVTITATVVGGAATIAVLEDVGNTGTGPSTDPTGRPYDNVEQVSVTDGTTTQTLSNLEGAPGNAVWLDTAFVAGGSYGTPEGDVTIHSVEAYPTPGYGALTVQTASGPLQLPVFDPTELAAPVSDAWRVQTGAGVGAVPLVDPADAAFPEVRVQTAGGVLSPHDTPALATILENFENGLGAYAGHTGEYDLVSDAYDGSNALRGSNGTGSTRSLYRTDTIVQQGDTVTCWMKFPQTLDYSNAQGMFVIGAQGADNATVEGYSIRCDRSTNALVIENLRDNVIASTSATFPLDEYFRLTTAWGTDDTLSTELYELDDTPIAATAGSDPAYSSGSIGFTTRNNNGGDSHVLYDYVVS